MTEFELMDGPLIQLADDGKTVVHNGKDIKKLKNRWTLGQLSDEELLNESEVSMERYPNEKTREKIEKLKERKKMHQEEFKTFVDELKDYLLSTKKGGRKKTKTYKKRSNKKKSIKKGRHSRRRRY